MHTPPTRTNRCADRSGFTLVELLVSISIIAILLGILLPVAGGVRNAARESSTVSLMTSIVTASGQYQKDTQRLPGFFGQEEMGASSNITEGFTQMENALLSLMGGVVPDPDNPDDFLEVGPASNNKVAVDLGALGSNDGYLTLDSSNLFFEEPDENRPMQIGTEDHARFPDVLDPYGNPILMWTQNSTAGPAPEIAEADSDDSSVRALFYWASNAAFLDSEDFGRRKNRNNFRGSVLSTFQGRSADLRAQSVAAIVGDPSYPIGTDPPEPSRARGGVILHSAGRDGILAENKQFAFRSLRYTPKTGGVTLQDDEQVVERLDDIIQGGL